MRALRIIIPTLIVLALAFWLYRTTEPNPVRTVPIAPQVNALPPGRPTLSDPDASARAAPRSSAGIVSTVALAPSPVPLAEAPQALQLIEAAATTRTPASLLQIAPYLEHTSAHVRAAARDGLLRLRDRDAAPLLREAALHLTDPDEIRGLIATAEFIEKPTPRPLSPAATAANEFSRTR
jgi:hypothetical protein